LGQLKEIGMKSVVVYESMFGNTQLLANAVASVLREGGTADVIEVGMVNASDLADVDLLVVGGPTHAWGLSWAPTRRSATRIADQPVVSSGRSLRAWLKQLRPGCGEAAAFDTRMNEPRFSAGSAACGIGRRLRRRGYHLVVAPASFRVATVTGPLADGELDRAKAWANSLLKICSDTGAHAVGSPLSLTLPMAIG
jgi:hypothetical protein